MLTNIKEAKGRRKNHNYSTFCPVFLSLYFYNKDSWFPEPTKGQCQFIQEGLFLSIPNAPVGLHSNVDLTSESTIIYSFSVQNKAAQFGFQTNPKCDGNLKKHETKSWKFPSPKKRRKVATKISFWIASLTGKKYHVMNRN